jgi:Family of unknown function (DUF6325)
MVDEILGPVDLLAVEFPDGEVTGEGFALLSDLIDRGVIRVLDLEFIAKASDGTVSKVALHEVENSRNIDVGKWEGAASGLLDQSDVDQVAAAIQAGSYAGILIYENAWAVPLMTALDRSNARLVGYDRIAGEDLLTALDSGSV